jgi:hypothetical protein
MWSDLAPHGDPRSRDAGALLKALRRDLIDPKIAAHAGRIVKLMGDSVLVVALLKFINVSKGFHF